MVNVMIVIIVLGIVISTSIVLLVTLGPQSTGCSTTDKPACTGGTLTCEGLSWVCKCQGQTYDGPPCPDTADTVCTNGSWSCMCGTESGSSDCSDSGAQNVCHTNSDSSKSWSCQCNGIDLNTKSIERNACTRTKNGQYRCTGSGDSAEWKCT